MILRCGVRRLSNDIKTLSDILSKLNDSASYAIQSRYCDRPDVLASNVKDRYIDLFSEAFDIYKRELRVFNTYCIDLFNGFAYYNRPFYNFVVYNDRWQDSHKYAAGYQMIQTLIEMYIEEYGDIAIKDVEANIRHIFSMNGKDIKYISFYITSNKGAIIFSVPISLASSEQALLSFSKYGLDFVRLINGFPKQFVFELIGISGRHGFYYEMGSITDKYTDTKGGRLSIATTYAEHYFPKITVQSIRISNELFSEKFGALLTTYLIPSALFMVSSSKDRMVINYFDKFMKGIKNPVVEEIIDDKVVIYPEIIGDSSYIGTTMTADYKNIAHIKDDLSIVKLQSINSKE